MICFALIVSGAVLAAFAVIVVSIQRCERRKSLFDPARGGLADAFTRKVLALHVHQAEPGTARQDRTAAQNLARRRP